jgi:Uma2 family endonuclease
MQAAQRTAHLSAPEYLEDELHSEIRHEYLGGDVYAMAGASAEHNLIAGNIFAALHPHLRGKQCQVFMSDMKVRLKVADQDVFYYPDLLVTCDSRDTERYFKQFPKVLIEVLSPETERTDRREKFLSYTQIETLDEYWLVSQEKMEVMVFRRKEKWRPEIIGTENRSIRMTSLDFEIPIAAIYAGVTL